MREPDFDPRAFRQCLEWTASIYDRDGVVTWADCEPLAFDFHDGRWFDLDMATALAVPQDRFVERRQHIFDIFSRAFTADALMMTPGLIEAMLDLSSRFILGILSLRISALNTAQNTNQPA